MHTLCFCSAPITPGVPLRALPTCSASRDTQPVTRRAALRGLGLLALSLVAAPKRAEANEGHHGAESHETEGRFGMKPQGKPHTVLSNEEELEFEGAEHFSPDWNVGSERSFQEGLRIFNMRLFVVGFTALFVEFARSMSDRESGRVKLPEQYDPREVWKYFAIRPDIVLGRAFQWAGEATGLALLSARHAIDSRIADKHLTPTQLNNIRAVRRENRAEAMRQAVERLGPAFMKLAQAVSMRPDILGSEIARQLQSLTDSLVAPFPSIEAFELLRKELGHTPQSIFQALDMTPFAGASLGMVYKGVINGEEVAVKIQRPGVAESVALDFFLLRTLVGFGQWAFKYKGSLRSAVDEYAAEVFEELDYRKEAKNMRRFKRIYRNVDGVYIPKVYDKYASRKVLISEYVDGSRVLGSDCMVQASDVGLVKTGISFALTQMLDKGFLHADMHNGNMLAMKSGKLAYIDFGMVVDIPKRAREAMVLALFFLIHGEYRLLAETFVDLGLMELHDLDDELPQISAALADVFKDMKGSQDVYCDPDSPVVCRFTLIGMAEKFVQLGSKFPLAYDSYFVNSIRCIAMLEGLALRADKNFQVLNVVYPVIMTKILSGAPGSAYRRALDRVLLTPSGAYQWDKLDGMLQEVKLAQSEGSMPTESSLKNYDVDKKPLDDLLLSRRGGYLRRQLVREWRLPSEDGKAGRQLSGQLFRRASIRGKLRALTALVPAVVMMFVFMFVTLFKKMFRTQTLA